jgi:outer membrane lipoprotein-sorting protein
MKKVLFYLVVISMLISSCGQKDPNQEIEEGKITDSNYESKKIGWTMEIPEGWTIITRDQAEKNDEKGRKIIEESSGIEISTDSLLNLISFQKNPFNIFAATAEPYKESYPGEYLETNKAICALLYDTYLDQGIKTDTVSGKETINGREFLTFSTTVYSKKGKVIMEQIMYSRLINGYDFCVNLNYNNEKDKQILMKTWKNSVFRGK